jgi:UTP--glucose-1-phosphate uridylyltransferase
MQKIKKAVIPAAGLGTRFLPATKAQPKEMMPIVDKPAIQYIVEEAVQAGIESIIIVTGRNKRAIEDHFDKSTELEDMLEESGKEELLHTIQEISRMANIHYIRQKEPLGLGHAVLCAKQFIGEEPFAVLLGDDIMVSDTPAIGQMMAIHEAFGTEVVGVRQVEQSEVSKYGIIIPNEAYTGAGNTPIKVKGLIEKPSVQEAPSRLAVMGRYILKPTIFSLLEHLPPGRGGEIQLTDALQLSCSKELMVALSLQGKRYDVGDKFGYLQANIELALLRSSLREPLLAYLESLIASRKTLIQD